MFINKKEKEIFFLTQYLHNNNIKIREIEQNIFSCVLKTTTTIYSLIQYT